MPQSIIRSFTLIIAVVCGLLDLCQLPPILLTQGSFDFAVSSIYRYWKTKNATLVSMRSPSSINSCCSPNALQLFEAGLSPSNFWLRFSITNPYKSRQEVIFTLSDSDFDLVEFTSSTGGDYWHIQDSHSQRAITGSLMQAHSVILNVPGQSTTTYLVQFHLQGLITAHISWFRATNMCSKSKSLR